MGIHKVDDIIIYTNYDFLNEDSMGGNIEKEIAEWIVDHYEYNIIRDILNKNYEGLTEDELVEIVHLVVNHLESDRDSREKKIEKCLKNYLKTENEINLQGFVRFRLKEYRRELEEVIDDIIDEYVVEKEYYSFIDLLKEFIEYQPSDVKTLNISISENRIVYKNEYGENMDKYIEKSVFFDESLTDEDKLLTTLVMLAPKQLNIELDEKYEKAEIKRTIELIFGDRVNFSKKIE